jgi:Uma2 family endonuclease
MATTTEKRYTPDDLLEIDDRPPPDLVDGHFEERELTGMEASVIAASIGSLLVAFSRSVAPGVVAGAKGGFQVFPDDPNKVRFPDLSFIRKNRLPGGRAFEGHCTVVPDLIVEVVSPFETANRVQRRIRDYLAAGVPMIWVVNVSTRDVYVILADRTAILLTENDTLDGGDVLPGFRCPVASFFE